MGFTEAVRTALVERYADFSGRSRRSEYWYFVLFNVLLSLVLGIVAAVLGDTLGTLLNGLVTLALLVPGIAVTVRRLHDTDRSGWWILISLVPIVGIIVLLVFMAMRGTPGQNRFGSEPAGDVVARFA